MKLLLLSLGLILIQACQSTVEDSKNHLGAKGSQLILESQSDSLVPLSSIFNPDTQAFAFVLPSLKPLKGVGGVEAKNCKMCHTQYYKEWSQTTHAHALSDMQFQAELSKEGSPKWLCLNCHIPNQDQREHIVSGLDSGNVLKPIVKKNPNFKKSFQKEAITCASCHLRQDEDGETVVIGAIGSELAPHPIRKDPQALRNTCLRCHDPKGPGITENLLCWFQTQDELKKNPQMKGRDCVSCHMPSEMGSLVEGMPKRIRHQHHWVGGGIPKTMEGFDSILTRGYHTGLDVLPQMLKDSIRINMTNQSGHSLPTSDPERYYRVDVIQYLGDQIVSDTNFRIGQIWQWSPAQKISDNRLSGGESRDIKVELSPVYSSKSHQKQIVEVIVSHHRLSLENLKHMEEASVDESLVKGLQKRMKQMEKLYPRFRFTHKFVFSKTKSDSQWILEKWTEEQLNSFSKSEHL